MFQKNTPLEQTKLYHKTADLIAVRDDGALIRRVNKSRYLGFIVDDRLSLKEQIAYIFS